MKNDAMKTSSINRLFINRLLLICLWAYLFLAFLPVHISISTGLDPSWAYGITHAAQDNLLFGKDIIFTFGPWGFLSHGVSMDGTWWESWLFKSIVHLLFWLSFGALLLTDDKSNSHRLSRIPYQYISTMGCALAYCSGISIDYEAAFTLLTVSTILVSKKVNLCWISLLGIVVGFLSLTKFSLGIQGLLLIAPFVFPMKTIGEASLKAFFSETLRRIGCLLTSFLVGGDLLLEPNHLFQKLTDLVIIAPIFTGLCLITFSRFGSAQPSNIGKKLFRRENLRKLFWPLIAFFNIFALSNDSIWPYLYTSLKVASGYSSAMTTVGPTIELLWSLVCLCLVFIYCASNAIYMLILPRFSSYFLATFLFCWFSFKHGFIRQDGHVFLFFVCILFWVSIFALEQRSQLITNPLSAINTSFDISFFLEVLKKILLILIGFLVLFYLSFPGLYGREIPSKSRINVSHLSLKNVRDRFDYVSNLREKYLMTQQVSEKNIVSQDLGEVARKIIGSSSVDIIPWDIVRVEKNNLHWQARPIFQSYVAYTNFLDKQNLKSFQLNPPDYLVYDFKSIDRRHPFFDEPLTFRYVLCNYKLVDVETAIPGTFILERITEGNRCGSLENINLSQKIGWNEPFNVDVNNNTSIFMAEVAVHYSLLGKIYKLVFRAPPTKFQIKYQNGLVERYRFIPENARGGLVISPLPSINQTFEPSIFSDKYVIERPKIEAIQFMNDHSKLYAKYLDMSVKSYQLNNNNG